MNIFYFSGAKLPSRSPQSVHCMKMAQALSKAGHTVTLFAKTLNETAPEDLFKIYGVDQNFKVHLSPNVGLPFLSGARRMMEISRKLNNLQNPDLVYGHDAVAITLFAPDHTPIVFEAHSVPQDTARRNAFQKLLKNPNLSGIVVASEILKNELLNQFPGMNTDDILVIHEGADILEDVSAISLKGRKDVFKIGYAGSLTPGKGLGLLSRVAALRPEFDFHVIGGNEDEIAQHELENGQENLYFYGYKNHADIPAYLLACDVLVAPYQHRALMRTGQQAMRWISPMKLFEYMAARKPILASALPTIEDILSDEETALLLNASDEEEWVKALDRLKNNPKDAEYIAENGYHMLQDHYIWDKRASTLIDYGLMAQDYTKKSLAS